MHLLRLVFSEASMSVFWLRIQLSQLVYFSQAVTLNAREGSCLCWVMETIVVGGTRSALYSSSSSKHHISGTTRLKIEVAEAANASSAESRTLKTLMFRRSHGEECLRGKCNHQC